MARLSEKQEIFLQQYRLLLDEIAEAAAYAASCYEQGDDDIGDRLLTSVCGGMLMYHPDNVTLYSIFAGDEEALQLLKVHYETMVTASHIQADDAAADAKKQFVQGALMPALLQWQQRLQKEGDNHAPH
ncbi:hypothetical protein [Alkalicoccus chagannorensis]|uniref:hypothetical protein n=1 Tax=Alkalicoccus chagannorensis TaxID=427072 RepID=UPI000411F465|nr:hypothetical protein [Alkalicoccus chagannorensis]